MNIIEEFKENSKKYIEFRTEIINEERKVIQENGKLIKDQIDYSKYELIKETIRDNIEQYNKDNLLVTSNCSVEEILEGTAIYLPVDCKELANKIIDQIEIGINKNQIRNIILYVTLSNNIQLSSLILKSLCNKYKIEVSSQWEWIVFICFKTDLINEIFQINENIHREKLDKKVKEIMNRKEEKLYK